MQTHSAPFMHCPSLSFGTDCVDLCIVLIWLPCAGLRPPYNRAAASGCLVPAYGRDPSACGKDRWPGSSVSPRLSKVPGYPACPLQDPFLLNPFLSGRKFHNPESPFSFDITKTAKEIQPLSPGQDQQQDQLSANKSSSGRAQES